MRLQALAADTLERAIRLYQDIAYGDQPNRKRGPDAKALSGDVEQVLGLW